LIKLRNGSMLKLSQMGIRYLLTSGRQGLPRTRTLSNNMGQNKWPWNCVKLWS